MTNVAALRVRLNAIEAKAAGTLTAKVQKLTLAQRAEYERWRTNWDAFIANNPGGAAFGLMLDDRGPPDLRRDTRTALFGDAPLITTESDAAEAYRRMLEDE